MSNEEILKLMGTRPETAAERYLRSVLRKYALTQEEYMSVVKNVDLIKVHAFTFGMLHHAQLERDRTKVKLDAYEKARADYKKEMQGHK